MSLWAGMRVASRAFSHMHVRVLVMPQLSPTMRVGKIEAIHFAVGQTIKSYDLALQVSTSGLTSVAVEGQEEGSLLVEIIEDDMTCRTILASVGDELKIGEPIAVFVDDDFVGLPSEFSDKDSLKNYTPALWQGYVMTKGGSGECGCS
jgi:pyruvate/2-oxoglutarate dehydrogenase complex dihydrolipoamide acyltransferase (E2) component